MPSTIRNLDWSEDASIELPAFNYRWIARVDGEIRNTGIKTVYARNQATFEELLRQWNNTPTLRIKWTYEKV